MTDQNSQGNWYDSKWNNPRARKNKARRRAKFAARETPDVLSYSKNSNREEAGSFTGVVAEPQKNACLILANDQQIVCKYSRKLWDSGGSPVVGDQVTFDRLDQNCGIIRTVLPRRSKIVRMRADSSRRSEFAREEHILAANVDIAVIVASAAAPPFHPRLIDRYLIVCEFGNVSPLICVNKIDLVEEQPDLTIYKHLHIPVVYVSAESEAGLDELREMLHGKYCVLTGQSGVGKSSIINRLIGREVLQVGEVGGRAGKGRHTTTVSTLHKLDGETYLVDTPGIRSLGLWEVDKATLRLYFPDLETHAPDCKFRNCLHTIEPACAVREAAEHSSMLKDRYASYLRMMNE